MAKPIGFGGRDNPDYGIVNTIQSQNLLIDLSELAVRIGSPVLFERTGAVLFIETFEFGQGVWVFPPQANASEAKISAEVYYVTPHCLCLYSDGTDQYLAEADIKIPFPYLTNMGLQFAFHTRDNFESLEVSFSVSTGTRYRIAQIQVSEVNDDVRLFDETWTTKSIVNINFDRSTTAGWHFIKLVVDFESAKYLRMYYDGASLLLKQYSLLDASSSVHAHLYIRFLYTGISGSSTSFYIDDIIVTTNEPG